MLSTWKTLLGLLLFGGQQALVSGQICYMVYQVADNDLEYFIRQDLTEMTNSPAVQDAENMVTWIYFDGGNHTYNCGGEPCRIDFPVENIFNADGTEITEKYEGARYLTWDANLGRMVVDTELPEQDSDIGSTVQTFLEYALPDCVAKGTTEYMLVFSSHGGGYAGFGGDDNEVRRFLAAKGSLKDLEDTKLTVQPTSLQRFLGYQSNLSIRAAILAALGNTPGAPAILDVLGFDACLMSSVGALDEFKDITRYYLASQATEPGHGWAYNELTVTTSARELAIQIQETFLSSLQGSDSHRAPKTLALTDTAMFDPFIAAWEELMAAMTTILQADNDPDFFGNLHRARATAVSFPGALDDPSFKIKAAMDIGSFLQQFLDFCQPGPSSQFGILVNNALAAYNSLIVVAGSGPATPPGTGMHISWVSKDTYSEYSGNFEPILFGQVPPIIQDVPNYFTFLQTYYTSATPTANAGSVCGGDLEPDRPPESAEELLIDPEVIFPEDGSTEIQSQIARSVDFVFVEYGIDVTHVLGDDGEQRSLRKGLQEWGERRRALAHNAETTLPHRRHLGHHFSKTPPPHRSLQEGDYFDLYGGDIKVIYDGPNIRANWDGNFFWMGYEAEGQTQYEPIYVLDEGGSKLIPVCYFPPSSSITKEDIPIGIDTDTAMATLGCLEAYLTFNLESDSPTLSLYVYQQIEEGVESLSEVPPTAGGQIVPILSIALHVGENYFSEILGGTDQVIISWNPDEPIGIYVAKEADMLSLFEAEIVFVEVFAYDDDTDVVDAERFEYTVDSGDTEGENGDTGDVDGSRGVSIAPTASPNAAPSPTSAASARFTATGLILGGLAAMVF